MKSSDDKSKGKKPSGGRNARKKSGVEAYPLWLRIRLFFRRNQVAVRAGGIFAACILVAILVYPKFLTSGAFDGLKISTAEATGFILNLFRMSVDVDGIIISSPDFSVEIVGECTAVVPMIIFVSAVVACPCSLRQKLLGVAVGIVGLYIINLVRTVSLFYIGTAFPDLFDSAHLIAWQGLMIVFSLVLWLVWWEKLVHGSSQ